MVSYVKTRKTTNRNEKEAGFRERPWVADQSLGTARLAQTGWRISCWNADDLTIAPDAQANAEFEAMMKLKAFAQKLDEAGFKEIQILPQAVLVSARDKFDEPVMLIFDTQTMTAVQVQPPHQSETTGSGPAEDKIPGGNTNPGSGKNRGSDTNSGR